MIFEFTHVPAYLCIVVASVMGVFATGACLQVKLGLCAGHLSTLFTSGGHTGGLVSVTGRVCVCDGHQCVCTRLLLFMFAVVGGIGSTDRQSYYRVISVCLICI